MTQVEAAPWLYDESEERPPVQARDTDRVVQAPLWAAQYRVGLFTADLCCLVVALTIGFILRFGLMSGLDTGVGYIVVSGVIAVIWLVCLLASGAYEVRHLATGPEECKRVLRATAVAAGLIGATCYVFHQDVARGFVAGVIPIGLTLLVGARTGIRRAVHYQRRSGRWSHRILAVGTADSVRHLVDVSARAPYAGLRVVGACVEDLPVGADVVPGVRVVGGVLQAALAAETVEADVVALAGAGLGPSSIRSLGWQLENTGRGLLMAPGLTEVAGPRVHVSPVDGLPLMWVDQPQFTGFPRLLKRALDVAGAGLGLLLALPVLAVVALLVKVTSPGPVLYRQSRLGINGAEFMVFKFRSMYRDAEQRRAALLELNEQDGGGVLFKIREDPRITPLGRWLRRLSIDEIPQLLNVLRGEMSLVGPRPLATCDSNYDGPARRRLLVRPGITGLWQVSGRSDTSWDDAVRMDLYYVENWSLGLDLSIIARTVVAVLRSRGAY